jgi:DNA-binding winged helix-turn-helix (wHTH) protein
MAEPLLSSRIVRFSPYEVDLGTGELRRDGARVTLQDKPFQVLALLVQRPGQLVTREELRSRLWPADTFVDFEHGLNTAVKKLRQALQDSADEPRYVETLPRRGYRFLTPVQAAAAQTAAGTAGDAPAATPSVEPGPTTPATTERRSGRAWRFHAAWLLVVLGAAALAYQAHPSRRSTSPPTPNAVPVVVLMDSPLPGRVYDPRTAAAGGTNADDITDALRDLPILIEKENTSPMWHREEQVLRHNPDLIVSHLSCLFDERVAPEGDPARQHLFDVAVDRLISFFAYVAENNPRALFFVYSRGRFKLYGGAEKFVADTEARFPDLRGRLRAWTVPVSPDQATFRDPKIARQIREHVAATLGLPQSDPSRSPVRTSR